MKIILLLLLSYPIYGNETYQHILKNKPEISKVYAKELSILINTHANTNKIDPKLISAIMMQESGYDYKAKYCRKGLNKKFELKEVCLDFGIMQVNYINIGKFDLDITRIVKEIDYSLKAGMTILAYTKKLHGHKKDWWLYYHSYNKDLQKIYKKKVEKWM